MNGHIEEYHKEVLEHVLKLMRLNVNSYDNSGIDSGYDSRIGNTASNVVNVKDNLTPSRILMTT